METASQLASKLSRASCRKFYDVYNAFDWPPQLQEGAWCMPPELISIHGRPVYGGLSEAQRQRVSLYELCNFFSLVLQGERLLVQGLAHPLYQSGNNREITGYLHHFLDEENKHMVMFGEFCHRYIGKVYPEKKVALPREFAKGEDEVVFFCLAMVVEDHDLAGLYAGTPEVAWSAAADTLRTDPRPPARPALPERPLLGPALPDLWHENQDRRAMARRQGIDVEAVLAQACEEHEAKCAAAAAESEAEAAHKKPKKSKKAKGEEARA